MYVLLVSASVLKGTLLFQEDSRYERQALILTYFTALQKFPLPLPYSSLAGSTSCPGALGFDNELKNLHSHTLYVQSFRITLASILCITVTYILVERFMSDYFVGVAIAY
ncbi:hypothetical protein OIU84_013398 [Salix udensis]|uniref:Uncharacterized protein n=1 Tax=Salix udensis TaxID=889485 RepID=A0AAD6JHY6_9ROSI|nr:hypothetical protein OIU84_013398 [Salix udensis]